MRSKTEAHTLNRKSSFSFIGVLFLWGERRTLTKRKGSETVSSIRTSRASSCRVRPLKIQKTNFDFSATGFLNEFSSVKYKVIVDKSI